MGEEEIRGEAQHQESAGSSSSTSAAAAAVKDVVITIEKPWIKSLEKTLIDGFSSSCHDNSSRTDPKDFPTIFRVPECIRSHDPKAYEPKLVSLGPYHHHDKHLQSLDELKLYFLNKFLNRNPVHSLADYIEMFQKLEGKARDAYSEQVSMSSDYFVRMMLLDCCFVLEIIMAISEQFVITKEEDELAELVKYPIISTPVSQMVLVQDMLLLENQLPFFLLELLFPCAYTPMDEDIFLELALAFLAFTTNWPVNTQFSEKKKFHHFLHLFHSSMAPPPPTSCQPKKSNHGSAPPHDKTIICFPSAVQLKEAGVHFEKKKLNPNENFFCITFDEGRLRIPTLKVVDRTNMLFRSLIAFEQCYFKFGQLALSRPDMSIKNYYVTAYAYLMDRIINTEADINFLQGKEIIIDYIGNGEEVAQLFNNLCKGVIIDEENNYVSDVFKSVNQHWNNEYNRTKAKLKEKYWSSPWAPFSLAGALILFLLTAAQTVYTILGYYQHE